MTTPEFPHPVDPARGVDRRAFLRLAGFGLGAAGVTACSRGPAQTALAHLTPREGEVPGVPTWIASTTWADGSGSGVLVRCLDGRPVKLEGNPEHPVNRGGLTASAQASVLGVYDDRRLVEARLAGEPADPDAVDGYVRARCAEIAATGGPVRVLTGTLTGPSTRAWIERFLGGFEDGRHVMYDALSSSALLDAQEATRGVRALPRVDLEAARVLAVFDADPLGTDVSTAGLSAQYAAGRRPDGPDARMSRHWQFEARLSLSGSRADRRVRTAPWELRPALARLAVELAARTGRMLPAEVTDAPAALRPALAEALERLADELAAHGRDTLVVCGANDRDAQLVAAWINAALDNHGRTWRLDAPSQQRLGDDAAVERLRQELVAGEVDLLVTAGCDPAYDLPGFREALAAAGTHVRLAPRTDESSDDAHVLMPEPHELECWDDGEPFVGVLCTSQPTLPPLREARTLRECLARWSGDRRTDRELLRDHWREAFDARRPAAGEPFEVWFDGVLERGFTELPPASSTHAFAEEPARAALLRIARAPSTAPADGALRLVLHPTVGLLDGRGAHNPWLQELPDPVTKTTWGNHAALAPADAARLGLTDGDVVRLSAADASTPAPLELPVLVQPGQQPGVVAVALGHGVRGTDRFTDVGPDWLEGRPTVEPGETVGADAGAWRAFVDGAWALDARDVSLVPTGGRRELACTQDHHELAVPEHLAPPRGKVRDAVRLLPFVAAAADRAAPGAAPGGHAAGGAAHGAVAGHAAVDLWSEDHPAPRRWGLAVDLAACTGCSACVVGCQAENNVPVVGRDEVRRHREMSWLRIDRYYADVGDGDVDVVHQPVMCQHCGHAPCETVCPVLATMHSSEGLNTQVYNRCVGTRYCANNCPYKTRRFNWFEYGAEDRLQNMVLNPEVTIRSRGVMEKCSLCVQRIQRGKAEARRRGEPLADGDVRTACQQSCPTQAIVFGDLADPESEVSRRAAAGRSYELLAELNVQPGVRYLADVRNREGAHG